MGVDLFVGDLLNRYTVMQQNDWVGRTIYTARETETGQVVYLLREPAVGEPGRYGHPNLPTLEPTAVTRGERWWVGTPAEGETLEDIRARGALTDTELHSVLMGVLDGLTVLSLLHPPLVPGYLDPACIRKQKGGRWVLDYLALAHAPEARASGAPPLGIYPLGVLLFWLITGQTVRRTRIQLNRLPVGMPAQLQFVLVNCVGRNYPSLAELKEALERAAGTKELQRLATLARRGTAAQPTPAVPPLAKVPLGGGGGGGGGPYIPVDDRPWALPARPHDGYRKFVVPPKPDPQVVRLVQLGLVGVAGLLLLVVGFGLAWLIRPAPPAAAPGPAVEAPPVQRPEPGPPATAEPGPQPPSPDPDPTPAPPAPLEPPRPTVPAPAPKPAPGTVADEDYRTGGVPLRILVGDRQIGIAYVFPHPTQPFISLPAYNELFGTSFTWAPAEGGAAQLSGGAWPLITRDYALISDRLWLKLTPAMQNWLGIRFQGYTDDGMQFTTTR